ncbi:hypothetical protein M3B43_10165 [Nesterenkonia massiliensis]|uniref:Restriction endonuclease type IV Mrr domain-containing protein n=1 Tax=Nesterenkonia massiliensis TaxID=1232429 RepID=A0ABT2HSK2_9MICC|nr:hypothetical protein [Nesterenkonia massiliensis]MCT1607674.1 hypothetical protein [Nesterenkonia massiliensis]
MTDQPTWDNYEELTRELIDRLARTRGVQTTRLQRNVVMSGKATSNQIDVLWEFIDSNGHPARMVFECRSHSSPIKKQALHSWRSVVEDISVDDVTTVGAMVTTTGYQSGARSVADTYHLVIVELREPNQTDVANRVWEINLAIRPRRPEVLNLQIEAVEQFPSQHEPQVLDSAVMVEDSNGGLVKAIDLLREGELNSIDQPPTPLHEVVREFKPERMVFIDGKPIARARAIKATVGEIEWDPARFRFGGLVNLSWMLKDTLTGAHVWFAHDGHIWSTDA